jgi:hypothetical protein
VGGALFIPDDLSYILSDFPSLYFVRYAKDNEQCQQGDHGIEDCERHTVFSFASSVLPMISWHPFQKIAEGLSVIAIFAVFNHFISLHNTSLSLLIHA